MRNRSLFELQFGALSDTGGRSNNEDAFWFDEVDAAAVVSDGMGGGPGGETASSLVIREFRRVVSGTTPARDSAEAKSLIDESIRQSLSAIAEHIEKAPALEGMGATAVYALLCEGRTLVVGSIGDSRAYLKRGDRLDQVTTDHSYVQALVDSGAITAVEADVHPQRNLITRCIGASACAEVDYKVIRLTRGDRVLLCTDGLTGFVDDRELEGVMHQFANPQVACEALVRLGIRRGTTDNITALVVQAGTSGAFPESEPSKTASVLGRLWLRLGRHLGGRRTMACAVRV